MRYQTIHAIIFVFITFVSVAGCSLFGEGKLERLFPGDGPSLVHLDSTEYGIAEDGEVDIAVSVTNPTDETIYASGNGTLRFELEKLVDGDWVLAFSFGHILIGGPPLEISANETVSISYSLGYADRPNDHNSGWLIDEVAGDYRVVVELQAERGNEGNSYEEEQLPLGYRTSSTFEIHE